MMRPELARLRCSFGVLLCLCAVPAGAQRAVTDVDTRDFPNVSLTWHTDNPDTLSAASFGVQEGAAFVPIESVTVLQKEAPAVPLSILLLWDPVGDDGVIPPMMGYLIESRLRPDRALAGRLRMNAAMFRRERISPVFEVLCDSFTPELETVSNAIADAQMRTGRTAQSSDLLWALRQAVDLVAQEPAENAKAIVLYTRGANNFNTAVDASSVIRQARERGIPIYAVNIRGTEAGRNLCQEIAEQTYGLCLFSEGKFVENGNYPEINVVKDWIQAMGGRAQGLTYRISFVSQEKRSGKLCPVTVMVNGVQYPGQYQIPEFSLWAWAKRHLVLFIALVVLMLAALGIGIFFLVRELRYRVEDHKEAKQKKAEEQRRLQAAQEDLRQKFERAEYGLSRQKVEEEAQRKSAAHRERLEGLQALMAGRNIRARLLVSTPAGTVEHVISSPEVTIGFAPDNGIVIANPTVSRHHAVLRFDGEGFVIQDLNSTNGTVMNGFRIKEERLRNGDSLKLGKANIKIYL